MSKNNQVKIIIPWAYLNSLFATARTAKIIIDELISQGQCLEADNLRNLIRGGVHGFNMRVMELRVIQGIFQLIDNEPAYANEGWVLIRRKSELYRAAGLQQIKTSRGKNEFSGWELRSFKQALTSLASQPRLVIAQLFREKGPNRIIADHAPLIQIDRQDSNEGLVEVDSLAGTGPFYLNLSQIFFVDRDRYYKYVPADVYGEIREHLPPTCRVTPYQILFILWLHRHHCSRTKLETNKQSLSEELGLEKYLDACQYTRIAQKISALYRLAYEMGYLLNYQEDVSGRRGNRKDILTLNPEKIRCAKDSTNPSPDKEVISEPLGRGLDGFDREIQDTNNGDPSQRLAWDPEPGTKEVA